MHEHQPKPQQKMLKTTDTLFVCFEDDDLCIEDSSSDINERFDHERDEYEYKFNTNQNIELDRYLITFHQQTFINQQSTELLEIPFKSFLYYAN